MPKAPKTSSNIKARSTPYPPVTTMAPIPAADSIPTPASGDHRDSKPWGPEEDDILLRARRNGENWAPIAAQYFPTKTANACRKRHERLIAKYTTAEWDSTKVEALAQSYMELREEMWKILAAKLDEKWEIVEKTCMDKGLKTLKSHGRTAKRKHRNSNPDDDDDDEMDNQFNDSGIGAEGKPGDETTSKHHQFPFSQGGQHDQHHSFPFGGPPATYSTYSGGISSGGHSSPPSHHTLSRTSSISYKNTPQQHQQSLPETLPGIASIFADPCDPCAPVTRY